MDFPIQTCGGTKNFLPHALAAWDKDANSEEAKQEAEARIDEQRCREEDEREQRRRLAELRAARSDEALAALRHRAEEALAADGVDRTRLGYEVLVKLKVDELLEREDLSADIDVSRSHPDTTAVESSMFWETHHA